MTEPWLGGSGERPLAPLHGFAVEGVVAKVLVKLVHTFHVEIVVNNNIGFHARLFIFTIVSSSAATASAAKCIVLRSTTFLRSFIFKQRWFLRL